MAIWPGAVSCARNRRRLRRRSETLAQKERSQFFPGCRRRPRGARRHHKNYPRYPTHLPDAPVRLRKSLLRRSCNIILRPSRPAPQRQPLQLLAKPAFRPSCSKTREQKKDRRSSARRLFGAELADENFIRLPTLGRKLHPADGPPRPLVRALPPLPHRRHTKLRQRAANRRFRPRASTPSKPSLPSRASATKSRQPPHHRNPRNCRRQPLDEPLLPATLRHHPLHLETRLAHRQPASAGDRKRLSPFQRVPLLLGKTLHHVSSSNSTPTTRSCPSSSP